MNISFTDTRKLNPPRTVPCSVSPFSMHCYHGGDGDNDPWKCCWASVDWQAYLDAYDEYERMESA